MMSAIHRSCILAVCFFCSTCFAQKTSVSLEEYSILDKFFQTLIKESEVGYVLQGKKPVCIHGFFNKDPFSVNTIPHQHSVALREGARIWQQLVTSNPEVMIHIAKKEDPLIPNWIHVMAIHRSLFQNVLNKNLSLFQYILGPTVSPESLLSALSSEKVTYHSLLKGDKVLIGEILGFGTQNALYVSRIENIEEALDQEIPPFLNIQTIVREYPHEHLPFEPGFGFNSVRQELEVLHTKVTLPSKKLISSSPEFVFGCLKESEENSKIIAGLEETQNEIQLHLQSQTFFEEVLHKLTGHQYTIPTTSTNFSFCLDKHKLNQAVARGIWESLQDYDKEYLSCFISGMENPEASCSVIDRCAYFPKFRRDLIDAKNNLADANSLFSSFEKQKDVKCVVPNRLYYRTLKSSQGDIECRGPLVSLEFSILSPSGHCIAHKSNQIVNLKNTIPGFSLGIKGMKVGETREIFIHPSLGYGFDTSLDKCIALRAVVTLQDICDNQPYSRSVNSFDLDFVFDENTINERTEKYKAALFEKGKQIAHHLKQCSQIDLNLVRNYLINFQHNEEKFATTTEEEQALINQMHWNIYFG